MHTNTQHIHAPEINREGLIWLNTEKPLSLVDLRGKLVLLDFWTFCCINCMHILPTLRRLEELFERELMVIGVHTPKFSAEKNTDNVKQAIARYGIRHPIIHDPDYVLWKEYGVHAWPTLIFIDPDGYMIGKEAGEPDPLHLLNAVRDALDEYEEKGTLRPVHFSWAKPAGAPTRLSFPGKIKKLPGPTTQWVVADSGHNQIVVFDDDGRERQRYGSGRADSPDGDAHSACFNAPQGLIANAEAIFVADTGNHAIRRIDRASGMVTTLAGTGERGMLLLNKFQRARGHPLASPWDLEIKGHFLFFANAGTHQIGAIDLGTGQLRVVAGNGNEHLKDGDVLYAELAQPSGLAFNSDGTKLYIADSETSALRFIDMKDGKIRTLVGAGLFDFGHKNGALADARLQHCLGVTLLDDDNIIVADSYNNALRLVDTAAMQARDLDNHSWHCLDPICLPFAEPAGVVADGPDRLLVADTNNHRVVDINRAHKTMRSWA